MPGPRLSLFLPILIAVLLLPSLGALLYVRLSGDSTLRPLGVTRANLAENPKRGVARGITVQIEWGRDTDTPNTRPQVRAALEKALSVYEIDYRVRFTDTPGSAVSIYFLVGNNRIGPYSLANVSSGIPVALAAR